MSFEPTESVAGNMYGREDAIRSLHCIEVPIGCGREILEKEIREAWPVLSQKEYQISGLCNRCQNKIFGDPEQDGCTCDNPCCEVDVGVGIITCSSYHCPVHGENDDS